MKLTIDFETRSQEDLGAAGPWRYASHPTTQVMCLGVKVDDQPAKIHYPDWVLKLHPTLKSEITVGEINRLMREAAVIEAHNIEFEHAIWLKCYPRTQWYQAKVSCTAARAAMRALPRDLARACMALGLPVRKSTDGNFLMKKMCKPRKKLKKEPENETGIYWHESLEDFQGLGGYCKQDCEAEFCLSENVSQLPPGEQNVWQLDQIINERGVLIDLPFVESAIALDDRHRADLLIEFQIITGIETPGCLQQILAWIGSKGLILPDLTAETVREYLADPRMEGDVKRVLEIRQSWGKTSVNKFVAMKGRAGDDGRARSLFMYHAATTGRFGGKAIQPQNLPSRGVITDPDLAIEMIGNGASPDEISLLWGDPQWVLSGCVRGALIPKDEHEFMQADFSAIEGRGLAWLAGEEWVLEAYRADKDLYKLAASKIFGGQPHEMSKQQRQVGKVAELACGYQGGRGALNNMAKTYGLPPFPDDEAQDIVTKWRAARPITVSWWHELQRSAISAIQNPGEIFTSRTVAFRFKGNYLVCRLPSGRNLYYPFPRIGKKAAPWGEMTPVIQFMGVDTQTHQWTQQETYGGKLAENITQAICRDLLTEGMLRVEAAGYSIVLHVHDEVVSEVPEAYGSLEEFIYLLSTVPEWAIGFPIKAEGWTGKRYRK